ncbi:MAG: PilZ domain-containing protein [Proteobacteria bacterium]|nr:PilZ domain-containing protein [Pseudomonadota bacterium]MBU1232591.1 PilZ domain-containing protein [Pseudomonadota bacterium]MBU1417050.1 PilZ domain-containing protein [Pseudomonadota bacterium]MBU1453746.1 PilZ domain-containing protein [Pseudomonadota bacterium]
MESVDALERREHNRVFFDIVLDVCLLTVDDSGGDFRLLSCRGRDISGGGLSFYAENRYPPDSLLRLRIPLNDNKLSGENEDNNMLKVMGKVMWSKKNGEDSTYVTGVQFLNIYEQDYHILKDYVEKFLTE